MADHVLESRLWLALPRPDVFAFFADPHHLELLTPPPMCLRLLTPDVVMKAGAVLEFRLSWIVVPLTWRAFIREYDPPYRFVDVQVRGPYAKWEHRHRFLEEGGGTWIDDRVTYRLPMGLLGPVVHALVVRRQLRALWDYRRRRLEALLGPVKPAAG
jgi:ligand-binding SRPBCC domain-containing protein